MKASTIPFRWLPRSICILAIGFISVFAADAFDSNLSAWQQVLEFLVHLIPSFILLAILAVSWKWEFVGGIVFTALGILLTPLVFLHNLRVNHFTLAQCTEIVGLITFPFIGVGVLFIRSHFITKKQGLHPN